MGRDDLVRYFANIVDFRTMNSHLFISAMRRGDIAAALDIFGRTKTYDLFELGRSDVRELREAIRRSLGHTPAGARYLEGLAAGGHLEDLRRELELTKLLSNEYDDLLASAYGGAHRDVIDFLRRYYTENNIAITWVRPSELLGRSGNVDTANYISLHYPATQFFILTGAVRGGKLDLVKLLLARGDMSGHIGRLMENAARFGRLNVVRYLWPLFTGNPNDPFTEALLVGNYATTDFFLSHADIPRDPAIWDVLRTRNIGGSIPRSSVDYLITRGWNASDAPPSDL